MIEILREAGYNGPLCILLTIVGVVACVVAARQERSVGICAMAFALVILGSSMLAHALGQHLVNQVVAARMASLDSRELLELMSVGTMEASRNLLLGGVGSLAVLAAGGGVSLFSRRRRTDSRV